MNNKIRSISLLLLLILANPTLAATVKLQNVHYNGDQTQLFIKGKLSEKADGAPVDVFDSQTGVLLATTTLNRNQFKLIIAEADMPAIPCSVRVEIGADSATSAVNLGDTQCGVFGLTIEGLVTDSPIPNAIITVTVGGLTYSTVADSSGAYSLDIATTNPMQIVTINATDDTVVDFYSVAGTFSQLLESAGPGNTAGPGGNPNLNVTNVSTAKYSLLLEANDGNPIGSDEELRAAETAVDATELLERAAIIKLIVDDPAFSLPDGVDNVFDLISDEALYDSYVEAVNASDPGAIEGAVLAILEDSNLTPGFGVDDIPSAFHSVPVAVPGLMARGGETLEFDLPYIEGGVNTGILLTDSQGVPVSQGFTWSLDAGKLQVDFVTPLVTFGIALIESTSATPEQVAQWNSLGYGQLNVTQVSNHRTYYRVSAGSQIEFVSVDSDTVENYDTSFVDPADALAMGLPLPPLEITVAAQEQLWNADNLVPVAFTPVGLVGSWAINLFYDNGSSLFTGGPLGEIIAADLVTFAADGTATADLSGLSLGWSINGAGELVISYPSGMTQTVTTLEEQGALRGLFYDFVAADGARFATYDFGIKQDPGFILTDAYMVNAPGEFWNALVNSWSPTVYDESGNLPTAGYWGWEVDSGGYMLNRDYSGPDLLGDANHVFSREMSWEVTAGNIVHLQGPWWYHCYFNGDEASVDCVYREWTPLVQLDNGLAGGTGKVFYALERAVARANFWVLDGVNDVTYFPARINLYAEFVMPAVATEDIRERQEATPP